MPALTAALLCAAPARAEEQRWPLSVAFVQEATVAPGLDGADVFTGPLHPGALVGTEYTYLTRGGFRLLQSFDFGAYHHYGLNTGVLAMTHFGPRYQFAFGLGFEALLGVGYLHTFSTGVYSADSNGSLVGVADPGHPHAAVSLAGGISFALPERWGVPLDFFARYQVLVETPAGFAPMLPHTLLQVGFRIALNPSAYRRAGRHP